MSFTYLEKDGGVAVVWLDQPNETINKISFDLIEEFSRLFDELEKDDEVKAIVLISKKKDNFIAGADIEEFLKITQAGKAEEISRKGNELLSRLASFPKPVVAAINGVALGGGLEVALACSSRIASDDPKTFFGLPEVKLGLLPGGGGTQRLPRLVGIQRALDMMLTGKNVYPRQAKRMGLVDGLIHPYGLPDAAKSAALALVNAKRKRKRKRSLFEKMLEGNPLGRKIIFRKARQMVERQTKGNYPAPMKILECVETGITKGMQQGLAAESKGFDELMQSPESRQLISLFFSMNSVKKNPLKDMAKPVSKIGILGAGLMGSGVANVSASNGIDVILKDVSYEGVGLGEKALWQDLNRKVRKRALSGFERDLILSRIAGTTNYEMLGTVELIIEAVFEDLELKRRILKEIEEATADDTIFASNTSSLPIKDIAKDSKSPEQIIGMHYFSPVTKMPLLEIIVTEKTADWVQSTAVELGLRQGKTVIVVSDGPGFYTTRILSPLLNEAVLLLEEGGDIMQIDAAMRRFGFPVGPFKLMDEVGIDVGAHVTDVLADHFAKRGVTASTGIKKLFEAGYKGKKNKKGFYRYNGRSLKIPGFARRKKEANPSVYSYFGGVRRKNLDAKEIQSRLSMVMINEAAHCLQEEILRSPRDGDLGAILGLGFPPFLGGPFRYVDSVGANTVLNSLESLESNYGARFTPSQIIRDYAKQGKLFYKE
jgi:3-hydroxyacyl-CoA dehydrogenase/enoyl-CoA hydratase/3-hydroxybutyryl-CoA epimerase